MFTVYVYENSIQTLLNFNYVNPLICILGCSDGLIILQTRKGWVGVWK